jgi:tetratricopeptide (TPR) repeat protein
MLLCGTLPGLLWLCLPAGPLAAQSDSLTLLAGRPLRGTVQSFTPDNIVVETEDGVRNVQPWNVRRIRYEGSNELVRAKSAFFDDRFDACLQEIENIAETPPRQLLQHELDYFRAAASARIALRGGEVSLQQAADTMGRFIRDYPGSYHLYPALDAFGDLAMALGRFDAATEQFEKTAGCPWPEFSFQGKLKSGKALLYAGKYPEAIQTLQATEADPGGEDYAVQGKLIARCLRAQALGLSGQPAEGRQLALQIIENENSKNIELFGYAYNALGACYAAEDKTKEAIAAFLHTDLLFTLDPESHAQALYRLVDLWGKSGRPDRASEARQKLNERYRNTYWAARLR